jgi:predicted alpha-1,6-mannanase (GH76 family)
MSVGPLGAALPETTHFAQWWQADLVYRRLRVTISSSERQVRLTIDDMEIRRADSRSVKAEYQIDPYGDVRELWQALAAAPRVMGLDPTNPPIAWISPTAFSWTTRSDTLLFEQKADSVFQVTLRARIR